MNVIVKIVIAVVNVVNKSKDFTNHNKELFSEYF